MLTQRAPGTLERTSVAEHADDAAALLDAVAAAPAIVVGRSYGGTVATDPALRCPDRSELLDMEALIQLTIA